MRVLQVARCGFGTLEGRFGSSALPVEGIILVWVHVYSNLRHRLQRTHLRAEKPSDPSSGHAAKIQKQYNCKVNTTIQIQNCIKLKWDVCALISCQTFTKHCYMIQLYCCTTVCPKDIYLRSYLIEN